MSRSTRRTMRWYFSVRFHSHTIISSPLCSRVRKLSSWRRSRQLSYLMRLEKVQIKKSRKDWVWCSRKERKRWRKETSGLINGMSLLSQERFKEEWLQASVRMVEEEGASCGGRRNKRCWHRSINGFLCWRCTSQSNGWIFDLGNTVHACSQKELFNSLVAKEERVVIMVDGPAWEVIDTGQSKLQKEMGRCMLWRRSGMSRRHDTI